MVFGDLENQRSVQPVNTTVIVTVTEQPTSQEVQDEDTSIPAAIESQIEKEKPPKYEDLFRTETEK